MTGTGFHGDNKVWGGRFREGTDEIVDRFNASIAFDRNLYSQDIAGSMAYCRMLAKQEIISQEEAKQIINALTEIKGEMDRGEFSFDEASEDIHGAVEKALVGKVGSLGEKLHTGRSRNDQVSLGYTHLQRAQPVLLSHHLLAYNEMLKRDRQRFQENLKRVNIMPLGSAALAGSTFDLDRAMVAKELGFDEITKNSMDAVSDRDFVLEFLFASSALMMHMSRMSEEMVIWSSQEFGFINLPDALCTGSSIMPQKKNPDLPELVRGKTGRIYGHLIALLTTMKGLPLTYNKDMQEDKEALFDTVDTVELCLTVMTRLFEEISFDGERMREAVKKGYLAATDLADYLVGKGVTFRQAHETVGKIVLYAMDEKKELDQLDLEELKTFDEQIEKDVSEWLDPALCIKRREIHGGTGPKEVKKRLKEAKREIET